MSSMTMSWPTDLSDKLFIKDKFLKNTQMGKVQWVAVNNI
jgi:hypothetical protein